MAPAMIRPQAQHNAPPRSDSALHPSWGRPLPSPLLGAPSWGSATRTGASPGLHVMLRHARKPVQKLERQREQCLTRPAGHRNNSHPRDFSIRALLMTRKRLNSSRRCARPYQPRQSHLCLPATQGGIHKERRM